jgi:WD40 repeat protein
MPVRYSYLRRCALVAVLALPVGCSQSVEPGYPQYRAYVTLDSVSSSARVDLYWLTATDYECFDYDCPPPGPPIAKVTVLESTRNAFTGFVPVVTRSTGGRDSATIQGLTDGRPYWFLVHAFDSRGRLILASRPIMTIPGPSLQPTGSMAVVPMGKVSWSPTGDSLVYIEEIGFDLGEMRFIDANMLSSSPVGPAGPPDADLFDAEWSPGGNRIAYTYAPTRTAGSIDYRVRVAQLTDSTQQTVTLGRVDFNGTWAGNDRIYYCRGTYDPPNIYQIWRADLGSTEGPRAITNDRMYKFHPSSRATDELIVFEGAGTDYAQRSLYLCNPNSGGLTRLTQDSWCKDVTPSWAPDGQHVIFISDRSGHYEAWSLNVATRSLNQLTRDGRGRKTNYARISSSGQKLAVVSGQSWPGHPAQLDFYSLPTILP